MKRKTKKKYLKKLFFFFFYLVLRGSKDAMQLVELISEYGNFEVEEIKLDLYFSPLCPFSRAVWLFCLETGIPIGLHKIDLLKEDQALDQDYKKFSQLSPSLQVPLLIDGEFVIEESSAICSYLCDRFFVGNHWFLKSNIQSNSTIYQQIDWMQNTIQIPIIRLWEACKKPNAENFSIENYQDFINNLQILDLAYEKEKLRCKLKPSNPYFQGMKPSLVDLFTTLILSFAQLIQGFIVNKYPNLKLAYHHFINQYSKKNWKEINYEFEGFFKYIITATSTGTNETQQIKQSILFIQQTPHTIYEMIQDPENDIFLFLASKTISTKTNAKLKRGLKKLNTDGSGASSENILSSSQLNSSSSLNNDEVEQPYIVNLDIGGEFNIRGREGTNLLLVPGKKIVQTSRMSNWEKGYASTVIFEFETVSNSHCLLHFTELNCPSENTKSQEENWLKFWKKINGVRVDTIHQSIVIKTKSPEQIYNILTDWKLLSKTIKSKIKMDESNQTLNINSNSNTNLASSSSSANNSSSNLTNSGNNNSSDHQNSNDPSAGSFGGPVYMHNNKVYANIISCIHNKKIIQEWRSSDYPDDLFSFVYLELHGYEGGCKIDCKISMVPFDKIKQVEKLWKSNMWKKLGGVVCSYLEQNIAFLIPPNQVCSLFLDGSNLSSKLKTKAIASHDIGSQFIAGHLKGTLVHYQDEKKIILCVSHKDWASHNSIVNLNLTKVEKGTKVHMLHENVPTTSLKTIADMWNSDFWEKLEAIQTTNICTSCILNNTSPEILYEALFDKNILTSILASDSSISNKIGGPVNMYEKVVKGTLTHFDLNSSIVMSIRYFNWPFGHYSDTTYKFDEINGGKGTLFTLLQDRVPINHAEDTAKKCEDFCRQLKKFKFSKK